MPGANDPRTNRYSEGGDEYLLDTSDAVTGEGDFMIPQEPDSDNAMAIDEEGRPRFAPAKDVVRRELTKLYGN